MIDAITWENSHLYGNALVSQHRLRHRVFVEREGYQVPTYHGLEYDQYDTPAAVYLVWRDDKGEARGISRLIPTERPYMIRDIWSDFVTTRTLPSLPDVWEATRFGVDANCTAEERSRITSELVLACLEWGLMHGIKEYLVLMPTLIIRRAIGGAGCNYALLGEPRLIGKHRVAVASVEVSWEALTEARRRTKISDSVLSYIDPDKQEAA
jgi:N-acyl-L-homoserine lactone synthetase